MLITFEGIDGSGKATYVKRLQEDLSNDKQAIISNYTYRRISYPDYDSPTGQMIKKYLHGDYGGLYDNLNHKTIGLLYSINREDYYRRVWKKWYDDKNNIILCDRYVDSNFYYVLPLIKESEQYDYIQNMKTVEYKLLNLPVPDFTIYLNMPAKLSHNFRANRIGKTGGDTGDIHEADESYLEQCNTEGIRYFSNIEWFHFDERCAHVISCFDETNGRLLS